MRPVVVLLHVGESLGQAYAGPLGASWRSFTLGAASGAYDERTGLASRYPNLLDFLTTGVPEWQAGAPLILVCWSAGCWAPRAWMRDPTAREAVAALLLLDGLHSGFAAEGGCKPDAVDGIVAFGELAAREPNRHLLVLTHTEIVPPGYASTTQCADLVRRSLPSSGSLVIQGYSGADAAAHVAQVREIGPALISDVVAPWLTGAPRRSGAGKIVALVAAALGIAAAAVILSR